MERDVLLVLLKQPHEAGWHHIGAHHVHHEPGLLRLWQQVKHVGQDVPNQHLHGLPA
jgi:hypothetical protein